MSEVAAPHICFVLSAPSGSGKTTLAGELLDRIPRLTRTVSCTTRQRRSGEEDGRDYVFVSEERFRAMVDADEFLEWAPVHGNLYGTPRQELARIHDLGHDAIMVIDVQGAAAVRERLPQAVTVFVLPPSRETLQERLLGRDARDRVAREAIGTRLGVAAHEIQRYVGYDYLVVNDDFAEAASDLEGIVRAERCRRERRGALAESIMRSFLEPLTDPAASTEDAQDSGDEHEA